MISDGYGDQLNDLDLRDEFDFEHWRPHLHWLANQVRPFGDSMHDDLVQEGAIAMWRAHSKFDPVRGNYRTHMHMAAKMRMMDVASERKKMLRPEEVSAKGTADPKRAMLWSYEALTSNEEGDPDSFIEALLLDPTAPEVFDIVASGYHSGEIARVIRGLSEVQREYVVARFWGGYTDTEISALSGISKNGVAGRWHNPQRGAKVGLRRDLAHLQGSLA